MIAKDPFASTAQEIHNIHRIVCLNIRSIVGSTLESNNLEPYPLPARCCVLLSSWKFDACGVCLGAKRLSLQTVTSKNSSRYVIWIIFIYNIYYIYIIWVI